MLTEHSEGWCVSVCECVKGLAAAVELHSKARGARMEFLGFRARHAKEEASHFLLSHVEDFRLFKTSPPPQTHTHIMI